MRGKIIVLEGTDGSGKGTHTKILAQKLEGQGHKVKTLSFPTYGTASCKPVELYLNGTFGENTDPYFTSMLYAYNRKMEMGRVNENLDEGTHYIMNRYTSANAGHQAGKIQDRTAREKFLKWLFDLEYDQYGLPRPDLTILLHMPPVIGQQFVAQKEEDRSYLQGRQKDVHEADLDHLKLAEEAYLEVAKKEGWTIIECGKPGLGEDIINDTSIEPAEKVRDLAEINKELAKIVTAVF